MIGRKTGKFQGNKHSTFMGTRSKIMKRKNEMTKEMVHKTHQRQCKGPINDRKSDYSIFVYCCSHEKSSLFAWPPRMTFPLHPFFPILHSLLCRSLPCPFIPFTSSFSRHSSLNKTKLDNLR